MKFLQSVIATLIFLIVLVMFYYFHITYFRVNVVFYASIADGIFASIITGCIVFFVRYFNQLNSFEKLQLCIVWFLLGYIFAISVPTVIDRSLSFYLLEKLQQRGGEIRQNDFERIFTEEYMKEYRLVDIRLTEQLESGTIIIDNGIVRLTEKGNSLAIFSRYFHEHWLPKKRLIMGEYTDDLIDPFKDR
ncbi:hypothetical protein BuS5_03720 [Desulfosarcina sp. BuS5]|uniref:hypothetical protein n=1 Tax=Desulfosarcina sp. BuS5 TaxID=933262 RepID=UPI0004871B97|nr:hypothetical protein [Desulfosarcina sp. BuS5]WDN90749.1 hypothetical protein BuS5_03720 [Desulfosarcina sp. BuS5]